MVNNNEINYCPKCGTKIEYQLSIPLENGADGECNKCSCYFEAYILNE